MSLNHEAIRKAYPNAVTIDDSLGVFDANGVNIFIEQSAVDTAAVIVAQETAKKTAELGRKQAYLEEADPIFFKAQRGEASQSEWLAKVDEIRQRFPY